MPHPLRSLRSCLPPSSSRLRPLAVLAAASLLAAGAGCGSDAADAAEEGWSGTVVDSAGVPVVQNGEDGVWGEGEGWSVREELVLGSMDGPPEEQFGQIVGVDVDGEGNLYVLDQQARVVRVFGPDGAFLRTVGSPGSGPGELGMGAMGVFVHDGEILVPDVQNQRVTRFSLDGESVGSWRLDLTRGIPIRWDQAGDGPVVAQRRVMPTQPGEAASTGDGDPVVMIGPEGSGSDTLLVLPAGRSLDFSGGQPRIRLFASEPVWDLGPDGTIVSGSNGALRLEIRDPSGAVVRVVTRPMERRPVTERDEEAFRAFLRELMTAQGAPPPAVEGMLRQMEFADRLPAFASVAVGPGGSVWVQHIGALETLMGDEAAPSSGFDAQDLAAPTWDVYDVEGRFQGTVEFPARFQVLLSEGDRFYGVARDEMDLQSLRVYRVVPGA